MKYGDEKKEKLDRLERKLYSRNVPDITGSERSELNNTEERMDEAIEVKEKWQETKAGGFDELASRFSRIAGRKNSFIKKIFVASVIFFVLAAGIAAFVFLGGMNLVSSRNVDIQVSGPITIPGGQEATFDINIINSNNVDLLSPSLLIEYPEGARATSDLSVELSQERFALERIPQGDNYSQNIKAVFFGEKESIKKIKVILEYRVENSSALFYKEKVYEVSISSSPIIITPTYPKEINANQDITFQIEIASNSKDIIKDFLINVEYPFGFVFKESVPGASFGNNIWEFSNLRSGEKKIISISGSVVGQDNEEKVFRINAGTADEDDERAIAVPFVELAESIHLKKPFIATTVFVEGRNEDYAARGGDQIGAEILIQNNLPSKLFNVSVEALMKGGAFDELSVVAGNNGFFQSLNDTIFWDKRSVSEFSEMNPGSQAKVSFSLSPFAYFSVPQGAKPEIEMVVTTRGERVSDSGSVEPVVSIEKRRVILTTDITLYSRVARSVGNLENSGPIPPKVDTPTTYTVIWSIDNSFNQVSNIEVKAILPPYVKWTTLHNPSSEVFSFNPVTNEVVWKAGSILPNTGFDTAKKEVQFQLEFLPSTSQIGKTPIIVGEALLTGFDKVAGMNIRASVPPMTIDFAGDPIFKTGDQIVIP